MDSSTSSSSTDGNSYDTNDKPELTNIKKNVGENSQEEKNEPADSDNGNIENPLEMVDIVNLLVKYLDGKSLKSSLMVSKLWNTEGMKIFFKNNFITVPKKLSFGSEEEEIEMINKLKTSFSTSSQFSNAIIKKFHDVEILQKHNILPGLKHVKVDSEMEYNHITCVKKVFDGCPNLALLSFPVRNFDPIIQVDYQLIKKCLEAGKNGSFTISDLKVEFNSQDESFQTIEKFVNSGVKVINLRLEVHSVEEENVKIQITNMIKKIIDSSKDVLKIQFNYGLGFNGNYPEQVFASAGPIPSVKKLIFRGFFYVLKLDQICQTFSEIETLHLSWDSEVDLKPVWKFCRRLKTLTFSGFGFLEHTDIGWLTQFTGYSEKEITSIWNSAATVKISPLVGQPSLLNLQDLEKLVFLVEFDASNKISKFVNLLQDFAFPNMPKLKKIELN